MSEEIKRFIEKVAQVSNAVGFQSGEPALEYAGNIISVLAGNPQHIERFMREGSELFIDGTFDAKNGSMTYRAINGLILHPSILRKQEENVGGHDEKERVDGCETR